MKRAFLLFAALTGLFAAPLIFGSGFAANAGDVYDYAAPFRAWGNRELESGRLPLWNPWIFGGTPFLASSQSALFYPGNAALVSTGLAGAFRIAIVLHLLLMGFGYWLWLRSRGERWGGAALGALLATFSLFTIAKVAAGHAIHLTGFAWTPYVFLLGESVTRRPENRWLPWAAAAASTLQCLTGHLQVWLVTHLVLAALVAGPRLIDRRVARSVGAAGFFGALLAAVQALPTADFLPHTTRGLRGVLTDRDRYAFATSYSLDLERLWRGWTTPWAWGALPKPAHFPEPPSVYFETAAVFLGWTGLALAVAGLIALLRRRRWRLPALAGGSLLLALGKNGPVYPLVWRALASLRVPARFYLGVHVALAAAAARGWSVISRRRAWGVGFFALVAGELLIVGRPFLRTEDPGSRLTRTELLAWFQERLLGPTGLSQGRVFTSQSVGGHNKSLLAGFPNLNGYEALVPAAPWREIAETQPGVEQPTTGLEVERPDAPLLTRLGLRYYVTAESLKIDWPVVWSAGALRVYENPARRPLLTVTGGELLAYYRRRAEKMTCRWRSDDPGSRAVWAETSDPGWRAWTRTGEIQIQNLNGVAQAVGTGELGPERIWWRYRPAPFLWGLIFTIAGATAGLWTLGRRLAAFGAGGRA